MDFEFYETEFGKIRKYFKEKNELRILIGDKNTIWTKYNPGPHEKAPPLPQFVAELSNLIQDSTGV